MKTFSRCCDCSTKLAVFGLLVLSGCGPTQQSLNEAVKFVGMTYFNYQQIWKRPPANWEDILTLSQAEGLEADRQMINLVRSSGYTVVWNVDCIAPGANERILAYHSPDPARGGKVLFADGSLRSVTAAEIEDVLRLHAVSEQ
jgi:hypothetical protein